MDEQALLEEVLQGDRYAISMVNDLSRVSQVWDDLIDKDKPVSDDGINRTFIILLSSLPRNPFYQANLREIQPIIESTIIDWMTSNLFENEKRLFRVSYILRDSLAALLICCAKIIGGMDWALAISPKVREFIHDESLEDYINEQPR